MIPLLAHAVVARLGNNAAGSDGATKIVDREALLDLREQYRKQGRTVVWTNGCFDLLHAGHVMSLQAARRHGDVLIVGLNSDASVARLKGRGRPIVSADERSQVLAALSCVDHVLVFGEPTPEPILALLKPDIHCKGADYAPPNGKPVPEAGVVAAYGGRIEYLPLLPEVSTTDLVRRVQERSSECRHG
jgi:D-beta-D-heptose 7-phosphate kinase/D-beta-D-heptose 1-phosphate adenosyltransferase